MSLRGVTAEDYKPHYQQDVEQNFVASGQTAMINPSYCLTVISAQQLAGILADLNPKIVMSTPYAVAQNSVTFSHQVPWFKFPSGCAVNCGLEANYWVNAGSGTQAEANCRKDIASAEACYEVDGSSQYPVELK